MEWLGSPYTCFVTSNNLYLKIFVASMFQIHNPSTAVSKLPFHQQWQQQTQWRNMGPRPHLPLSCSGQTWTMGSWKDKYYLSDKIMKWNEMLNHFVQNHSLPNAVTSVFACSLTGSSSKTIHKSMNGTNLNERGNPSWRLCLKDEGKLPKYWCDVIAKWN